MVAHLVAVVDWYGMGFIHLYYDVYISNLSKFSGLANQL